jgi:speckle-type POZ protein
VKPSEDLSLRGDHKTIPRVQKGKDYPCQMQKSQAFSCLFKHYAKHNGLKKDDLVFYFTDELKPDETPETVHLMPNDEITVCRRNRLEEDDEEGDKHEEPVQESFLKQFSTLLETGEYADVTFLVGPEETTIRGHKALLSVRSDYFRAMFKRRGDNSHDEDKIKIPGHSPASFSRMLEFLYTDSIQNLSEVTTVEMIELLVLADVCLLHDNLIPQIEKHLCAAEKITKVNVAEFLLLSISNNAGTLKRACLAFINEHRDELIMDMEFRREVESNPDLSWAIFEADTLADSGPLRKRTLADSGSSRKRRRVDSEVPAAAPAGIPAIPAPLMSNTINSSESAP